MYDDGSVVCTYALDKLTAPPKSTEYLKDAGSRFFFRVRVCAVLFGLRANGNGKQSALQTDEGIFMSMSVDDFVGVARARVHFIFIFVFLQNIREPIYVCSCCVVRTVILLKIFAVDPNKSRRIILDTMSHAQITLFFCAKLCFMCTTCSMYTT